ncbi:MAG: DUF3962 domain-containing protein [Acidobacteria bacterium]|nr:DUF3962 domain-containing protein [Acidobacteriota bacterium]
MIETIRTLSFRIPSQTDGLLYPCKSLTLPAQWNALIDDLWKQFWSKKRDLQPMRSRSLQGLLLGLLPQLVTVESKPAASPWICSVEEIDRKLLRTLVAAWMQGHFSARLPEAEIRRKADLMNADDLEWQDVSINLIAGNCNGAGTISLNDKSFTLLPDLLAKSLTRPDRTFFYGSFPLHFYRSPITGRGIELFSWPPRGINDQAAWSVLVRLTLQTIPYQSFPVINCDFGIRRWVSEANSKLGGGNRSVYLQTGLAGADAGTFSRRFQVAKVRWSPPRAQDGRNVYDLNWVDVLPELFESVVPNKPVPTPNQLLREPLAFIDRDGVNAVMVYSTQMLFTHEVRPGVMPPERQQLLRSVAACFEQDFGLAFVEEPFRRKDGMVTRGKSVFPRGFWKRDKGAIVNKLKPGADDVFSRRRRLIVEQLGTRVKIEIRYLSEDVRDALLDSIGREVFGEFSAKGRQVAHNHHLWEAKGLTIEVQSSHQNDLADKLDDQTEGAFWRRVEQIKNAVPLSPSPIGSLIEINDSSIFQKKQDADPKTAMRIGYAQTGRLAQFITTTTKQTVKTLPDRARAAVLDLLRHLGVAEGLPKLSKKLERRVGAVAYVAFSMLKRRSARGLELLPMMLYFPSAGWPIQATASGMGGFMPYSQFLLRLAERNGKARWLRWDDGQNAGRFVKDWLRQLPNEGGVLLLTQAQNSRRHWSWLADKNITLDSIQFDQNDPPFPAEELKNLRVVRVRQHDGTETPQVVMFSEKDARQTSYASGLFQLSSQAGRVYYSVAAKPAQQRLSAKWSKAEQPDLQAWNPGLVEVTVPLIQSGDDPVEWAALAHKLRDSAMHFSEALKQPLPLHLASLSEEYITTFSSSEEESD